jgi:hypothetical protein
MVMKQSARYDTSALIEAQFETGSHGRVLKNKPVLNFKDITGRKRKEYFTAIKRGLSRDYGLMEILFEKIIERTVKSTPVEKT